VDNKEYTLLSGFLRMNYGVFLRVFDGFMDNYGVLRILKSEG